MGNEPYSGPYHDECEEARPVGGTTSLTSQATAMPSPNVKNTPLDNQIAAQDGINQTLQSNSHRLSMLLEGIRGPVPEQVPEPTPDFQAGKLGSLEGITGCNIRLAEQIRTQIAELEAML